MITFYWIIIGSVAMAIGAVVLGIWLRRNPSKENAEKSSRMMHFLFFAGQIFPPLVGLFYPWVLHTFDKLVGLEPLPFKPCLPCSWEFSFSFQAFYFYGSDE